MRFLVYLITLLFVGVATAQNPTILQGNYITNVFGQANFVKNPNALINGGSATINPYVTPANATVTRSTTTPLVATTEFNVTTSTATGYVDWDTRTFDAGMKNQNCEARFTYRGFSVGSTTAQIIQGASTVVAQLTLTASTDPRIASINFPCGDLSAATKFRLQQATASLTGTNEIGGIYVGLATNMANVAQAEFVGSLTWSAVSDVTTVTSTSYTAFPAFSTAPTVLGNLTSPSNAPAFTISSLKPGNYRVILSGQCATIAGTVTDTSAFYRLTDGSIQYGTAFISRNINPTSGTNIGDGHPCGSFDFQYSGATISKTFQIEGAVALSGNNVRIERSSYNGFQISVYRFPSSSELVVKPETQNNWGSIQAFGGTSTAVNTAAWSNLTNPGGQTRTNIWGKASAPTTANDIAIKIDNLPVGYYEVSITGQFYSVASASGNETACGFAFFDGTNRSAVAIQASTGNVTVPTQATFSTSMTGVFYNSSVQNKTFSFQANRLAGSGSCYFYSDGNRPYQITVIPLDQPSNSALYVQGPVQAAATGAAIPSGYQGELQEVTYTSNVNLSTAASTYTDLTNMTLTLNPGVWELSSDIALYVYNAAGTTTNGRVGALALTDNLNNVQRLTLCGFANATTPTFVASCSIKYRVTLTTQTTYKLRAATVENNGATTNPSNVVVYGSATQPLYFRAVRVN